MQKEKKWTNAMLSSRRLLHIIGWMLLLPIIGLAQTKTVTGTVNDENGSPLPGVSIIVKGKTTGTKTDASGKFTINVLPSATLVVSYVSYQNAQIVVGTKTDYTIQLKPNNSEGNEVVVVGYGTVRRKDLTGAVGSVNMKDFEKAPVKSLDDALAGRVAGVQVQSNDGQPGGNANIIIRGSGSITQDNSPLYVVDGFPLESGNFNSISPDDIESIDVLKDASATSRYGARGSNGVVLITTKKGKKGEAHLTYNAYYGLQSAPKKFDMMKPYDYVSYMQEFTPAVDSTYLAAGTSATPTTLDFYSHLKGVDLQDYIYQTGSSQSHDIAVRGGTDQTRYSFSGNFLKQDGVIINSGYQRFQGRLTLDQNVGAKLKVGINANYSYGLTTGQQLGNASPSSNASGTATYYASTAFLYGVLGYRPTAGFIGFANTAANYATADSFNNATLIQSLNDPALVGNSAQDYRVNPYINIQNQITNIRNNTLIANAYAEYALSKQLTLRVTGGVTNIMTNTQVFNNSKTQSASIYNSSPIGVNGSIAYSPNTTWINENMLTYKNSFGDHHLTVTADFSEQGNKSSYTAQSGNNLPNEDLGLDGLDLGTVTNSVYSSRWTMASALGILNYDYKSKYLLTASIRSDASSKFATANRWGTFPAAAIAWRFTSEDFMKNIKFISDGKLRLGYGSSGNNRVSDFAYLPTIGLTSTANWYSYNNQPTSVGAGITSAGNYDLKWETTNQTNIGLDLSFFKSRLNLTVDAYKRVTHDLLLNASLPYIIGVPSASGYENVGSLQNKGLEFNINTVNVQTRQFTWTSSFNISFNQNKILSLAPGQQALLSGSGTFFDTRFSSLSPYIAALGRSVGEMYGYQFDGVYQYKDFDKLPNGTYLLKPNIAYNATSRTAQQPGDIKYKDLNGDLVVDAKDYTVIGSGIPKYFGGFSNNFRYANFDLNIFLQYSVGNDVVNANRYIFEGGITNNPNLNQFASYKDRWEPNNPSNTLYRTNGMPNAAYSSRVIEDGSYLKLRTVSLGYNFPTTLMKRAKMQSARIYASAQNLLTWTKYSGQDPEASSRNSNLTPGFDYSAYPHSLSAVVGVQVTF